MLTSAPAPAQILIESTRPRRLAGKRVDTAPTTFTSTGPSASRRPPEHSPAAATSIPPGIANLMHSWDAASDNDAADAPPSPLLSGSRSPPPTPTHPVCAMPGTVIDVMDNERNHAHFFKEEEDEGDRDEPLWRPLPALRGALKAKTVRRGPRPRHYSAPYPVSGTFLPVATGQPPMRMRVQPHSLRVMTRESAAPDAHVTAAQGSGASKEITRSSTASDALPTISDRPMLRKSDVNMSAEDIHAARVLAGFHIASLTDLASASVPPEIPLTRRASIHASPTSAYARATYAPTIASIYSTPAIYAYPLSPTFLYPAWPYLAYPPPTQQLVTPPSPAPSSVSGSPPPLPTPAPSAASLLEELVQLAATVGTDVSDVMVSRTLDRMRQQITAMGAAETSRQRFDADYAWLKKYLAIRLFTGAGEASGTSGSSGSDVSTMASAESASKAQEVSVAAVQAAVNMARGTGGHGPLVLSMEAVPTVRP